MVVNGSLKKHFFLVGKVTPTPTQMTTNTIDVQKIKLEVNNMINDISTGVELDRTELEIKYKYLFKNVKTLFDLVIRSGKNFQIEMLDNMLLKITKIQTNTSSQEKESENVGQELFDKYISNHVLPK